MPPGPDPRPSSAPLVVTADSVARFAGLLAERSRAAICLALVDGRAWTTRELAAAADIAPSTASEHVTSLVTAGLLVEERQGRHRYARLAGPHVAQLLEDLGSAVGRPARPSSLRSVRVAHRLGAARTCYDHLAGALGVAVYDGLVAAGHLSTRGGVAVTDSGLAWFTELAGPECLRSRGSRPLVRTCLDWTERRHHLGGSLGATLLTELTARAWVERPSGREVRLTHEGAGELADRLGVEVPAER